MFRNVKGFVVWRKRDALGRAVCALSSRPLFLTLVRCVCLSPPPSPPGPFAHAARPPPVCAPRPACVSAPGHPGVPQEAPPRLPRKAHGPAEPPRAPAAWLHAVGFGVRDFVAVVRKASFPCVVLVTCTLSRGVPVVVCVFTPLRAAEGKRSPRLPAPAAYSVRAVHVLPKPASRLRSSFSRVAFVTCVLAGSLHISNLRGKRSKS